MTASTHIVEPLDPVVLLLDDEKPERFPEDEDVSEANDDEFEDADDADDADEDADEIEDEEVE